MRRHITGLLLALILLALAIPVTLNCCFGQPPVKGPHAQPAKSGYTAAAAVVEAVALSRDANSTESAARDCTDRPAPAQTPYIETGSNTGSSGTATSRGVNPAIDASAFPPPDSTVSAHRHGMAADDTGPPPLWLRTCVSRT